MAIKTKVKRSSRADATMLDEAFDEFIYQKRASGKSEATIKNYVQSMGFYKRFNNFGEETTTEDLTPKSVYSWITSLQEEGTKHTTINHYLRDVRSFLYWCMNSERRFISESFKISEVKGQEEAAKLFTDEELEILLQKPFKKDSFTTWRNWAIVNWVLATGNRAQTICDVRMEDVSFRKKEIVLAHTKNKKAQIIPLSKSLETALNEYARIWRSDASEKDYLFPNIGEEQMTTNALRLSFSKYCKNRGVEHTSIHGLRHNFAKGWIMNDGNIFKLQKVLGHAGISMTRKYVRLYDADLKEDYDQFSPLDNIKKAKQRTRAVQRNDY